MHKTKNRKQNSKDEISTIAEMTIVISRHRFEVNHRQRKILSRLMTLKTSCYCKRVVMDSINAPNDFLIAP